MLTKIIPKKVTKIIVALSIGAILTPLGAGGLEGAAFAIPPGKTRSAQQGTPGAAGDTATGGTAGEPGAPASVLPGLMGSGAGSGASAGVGSGAGAGGAAGGIDGTAGEAAPPAGQHPRKVSVIIVLRNQPQNPSLKNEAANKQYSTSVIEKLQKKYNIKVKRQFGYLISGIYADVQSADINQISAEPEVSSVQIDTKYEKAQNHARKASGAASVHSKYNTLGTGTVISIIDDGLDTAHPDLQMSPSVCKKAKIQPTKEPGTPFTCKVPFGYNYPDGNYDISDSSTAGHGMHVAGIVAASAPESATSAPESTRVRGIAPNAQILAMKVFTNFSSGERMANGGDVLAAIEDSVRYGADVINLSMGKANGRLTPYDPILQAIEKAKDLGVIFVMAAGNSGLNFSPNALTDNQIGHLDDGTVSMPVSLPHVISVGALMKPEIEPGQKISSIRPHEFLPFPFSGWGPGPLLEFKPDISTFGYNIRSIAPGGGYAVRSGTSMAVPNISGMLLLLTEHYKKKYPDLTGSERIRLIRANLMNTAIPPTYVYNSQVFQHPPRRVGAGVAQVHKAFTNNVAITYQGEPSIALKEIRGVTVFRLQIKNYGEEGVVYYIPKITVLSEKWGPNKQTYSYPTDEQLKASAERVILNPGETKEIEFTLTPDTAENHWLEGWIYFHSVTKTHPDLSIPFLGFVGDWGSEKCILEPNKELLPGMTSRTLLVFTTAQGRMIDQWWTTTDPSGKKQTYEATLTKNPKGEYNTVRPYLFFLRSPIEVTYQILDANGKLLRQMGKLEYTNRFTLSEILDREQNKMSGSTDSPAFAVFDGVIAGSDGKRQLITPGKYIYRVISKMTRDSKPQIIDMPFSVQ